jgi:hypothetical protein
MSFQRIINGATSLNVDKRKTTAMSVSRSGHIKTAERQPSVYKFTVAPTPILKYSTNRDLLEDIDTADRVTEANVSLADNSNMAYITNYQGNVATAQLNNITVVGSDGKELYINTASATGSGSLFKKGDFIQPKGNIGTYRYPYQVTSDVTFSAASNVTIPVHRPVLSIPADVNEQIAGAGIRTGGDCRFHVKATKCPTYTVVPHDLVQFTGDFEFVEIIT